MRWLLCKIGFHSWSEPNADQRRLCVRCWRKQQLTLVDFGRSKVWLTVEK